MTDVIARMTAVGSRSLGKALALSLMLIVAVLVIAARASSVEPATRDPVIRPTITEVSYHPDRRLVLGGHRPMEVKMSGSAPFS